MGLRNGVHAKWGCSILHAYYPEINGDKTTYWRETLKRFVFGNDSGKDKWTSYQFTLNVCQLFALPLLERLKAVIDELSDPLSQSLELAATFEDVSVQSSQDDLGVPEFQGERFKKPRNARGLNTELRNMIQMLQRQVERQAEDAGRQQREAKERETLLLAQLEQQREKSEQQLNELMEMLKEQREEIKGQRAQIERLLPRAHSAQQNTGSNIAER